ncbi:BURP domain protein USPL1 [Prunus yedoensis var. nudiflora]|uniref:BURP domain protein USPL1 n=1 Tax=Prunus yedoensis var. nudiflora TaxID=2094558 RepID=A0A314UMQ5_PRUYE|nr:BURP domain protein USPL1 [Prunus yedoensis var. nudiflora]
MARTLNKGRNMPLGLALWSPLLHLLVLVLCVQGTGGRKMSETQDDSPQAKAMKDTLRECEIEPIKGEIKSCATSLESMLDFTRGVFGVDTPFSVVATTHLTNSTTNFQNYTILEEPKEISAPKMVACHTMPYPYAVFYCHSQQSVNRVFKVLLGGEDGDRVEAVAVCHLDTSQWSPNHASFSVLRTKPGASAGQCLNII